MTSIELTNRLIDDVQSAIAIKTMATELQNALILSIDYHLDLIAQLINYDGEQLISHQPGAEINLSHFLEQIVGHKEKIIRKIQHFIEEDPFVTLPDNQSISGELIDQLELLHTAVL